jgi:hypothetical protein
MPSSSSHALIGGLVGAGLTKAGVRAVIWPGLPTTGAFIVLSPLFGFLRADSQLVRSSLAKAGIGGDGTGPGNDDMAARHLEKKAPASKWAQFLPRDHALSLGHNGRGATHSG